MHSASRSTDRLNITRAPTPKANLNAHVTALIKMLWRHAAMLTSCIVFLTLWLLWTTDGLLARGRLRLTAAL